MTALMYASDGGYVDCVETLLKNNADPHIQDNVSSPKAVRCLLLICVPVVCVIRESRILCAHGGAMRPTRKQAYPYAYGIS